jgi:hypothetical protein
MCRINPWVGPPMSRIPQPIPSETREGHYKDVFHTQIHKGSGELRDIDDYAPRANLKKMFKCNLITSNDHDTISQFAAEFHVDMDSVTAYVSHMEMLEISANIKAREREK